MTTKPKSTLAVMELAYMISQMIESEKIKFADIADREQFDHLFRSALYRQVEQMEAAYMAPYENATFPHFMSKNFDI